MKKIIVHPHCTSSTLQFDFSNEFKYQRLDLDWRIFPKRFEDYNEKFKKVMQEIYLGNTFLINLACSTTIKTNLSLLDIYRSTQAKYKVYLENEFTVFSPETFIKILNGNIYTYPMKGTIDASIPQALDKILSDEKELAEHYTIVDLLRNDLSIVAKEVEVTRFRYPDYIQSNDKSLIQISSEIKGKLSKDFHQQLGDMIFALLPAGSICGAPKKKTVEIIGQVEREERGYYTGICGYFDGKNLDSGVMIRYVEQGDQGLQYKSGGGITFQSDPNSEYQEMVDKVYLPISSSRGKDTFEKSNKILTA